MTIVELNGKLGLELGKIVGEKNVSSERFVLISYSEDASPFEGNLPQIVVRPNNAHEVSRIMEFAYERDIPVIPVGGRSSINGSTIPRVSGIIMIDMTRMRDIIEINEDIMTVTVQSGITWSELIHRLKEKGYKLGFRGPYGGNAGTIGGSLSANSIGCGASSHGGACDNITGLEVVLSTGEIINTGSNWRIKTSKFEGSYARYCTFNDMSGIFLGDHGSLGIKTKATLKIFPLPKGEAYSDFGFSSIEQAVKAFHEIQSNHLVEEAVMLGDTNSIDLLASSYRSTFKNIECILAVIIEEPNEEIAQQKKEMCEKIVRKYGGKSIGMFLSKAHWLNMFNLVQSLFEEGFWYNTCHIRPISTLPQLIEGFHHLANKYELKKNGFNWIISALGVDHCFTSGWITIFMKDRSNKEITYEVWDELRELEMELDGVPYWTGKLWEPYALKRVNPSFYKTLKQLKKTLDPKNIINPLTFGL
ncbi:MAG: FAD-binding protein [Candidatus Lokiarchaeota archaeon]|nr:FAD-binding protein [Candidatus Lokiarchaeota archaeon]MBD3198764.1 FAD-binding protein [Candidatus Lokiarchaeota archaeon]